MRINDGWIMNDGSHCMADRCQISSSRRLTVQDEAHQRLAVPVQDLPQGEGLQRCVRQQPEEQRDGVVRGQTFRVDEPVEQSGSERSSKGQSNTAALSKLLSEGKEGWGEEHLVGWASTAWLCRW